MASVDEFLFNSSGEMLGFRVDRLVFDADGNWIGWLPWDDFEIVDKDGEYIGHIYPGHRLYRKIFHEYRGYPGHPPFPSYPGYISKAARISYSPLPPGTEDVDLVDTGT